MIKVPHKSFERKIIASGYDYIVGVDEVGMGCLAGPVTVCAVIIHKDFYTRQYRELGWLRDSKLLQSHQREKYSAELMRNQHIRYTVHSCTPAMIDKLNIYQASRYAMKQAIKKLAPPDQSFILVDGPRIIKDITHTQQAIIKGDRHIFAIAAASIIAKVHRDTLMIAYAKKYPDYGFEQHKGYGTTFHRQQIQKLGPSILHRKSFRLQ